MPGHIQNGQGSPRSSGHPDSTMGHTSKQAKDHYAPKPSWIACWHAFYHRNQAEGELINQYIAALRKAGLYCKFRDLDEFLLDRVVCEVRDVKLQQYLLAKPNFNLQMADEAQAAKMSNQSTAEIQKSTSPPSLRKTVAVLHDDVDHGESTEDDEDVCQFKSSKKQGMATKKKQTGCVGCGGNNPRRACKFKNILCQRWDKKGHLAKVCRASQPTSQTDPKRAQHKQQNHREECFIVSKSTSWAETVIGQASLTC